MPTRDKFVETYHAWLRADDQHRDLMAAIMDGRQPLDAKAMHATLGEVERLHHDWMALAERFAEGGQGG
ncbi:MAG: hypothetical protein EOP72_02590 [Variovorax sp.]|jgi:hypothetical protein|nr:MAG: hypothetical protein EOP72_02590 [Variovorax sp.]